MGSEYAIFAGSPSVLQGLGRFVNWLPFSVVRGVFVGVGGYIFMTQTLWFLGAPVEPGIGVVAIIASWPQAVANLNVDAFAVATISLAVFMLWPARLHRVVPNALVALVVSTLAAALLFDSAARIGEPRIGIPALQMPLLTTSVLVDAIQPALIIDPIAGRNHKPNRELFGLGVGNIVAGMIGALPGAASAPCSLLAARSGGRTPVTGVVCAAVLLAVLLGLGGTLAWIPNAAFAGILIKVGWDMMDVRFLRRIPKLSPDIGLVTLLTAALSTFVDVISAIAVGFFISGMAYAMRSQRQEINQTISTPLLDMVLFDEDDLPADADADADADPFRARVGLLSLRGRYSIASAREIVRVISPDLADHEVVIFDFSETAAMDESAGMAMEELINGSVLGQDKGCIVAGLSEEINDTLTALGIFDRLPEESFAADLEEAKRAAARMLRK